MYYRILCLLLACGCIFAQDTLIDGTAVDLTSGAPLAGVHIRLFTIGAGGNPGLSYGATTDRAGHFSIAGIRPGSYFYFGEKTGYVTLLKPGAGPTPFSAILVKAGEKITGHRLEMSPRSTITGRVLDEFGDPIQNATVQVTPVSRDAVVAFSLMSATGRTDERGEYSVAVAGGKYHVKASVFAGMGRNSEVRTDGTTLSTYAPTYFPSAPATDRAVAVDVAAGAEVRGIDIRMGGSGTGAGAAVEGAVTGAEDLRFVSVQLYISETPGRFTYFQFSGTPDGKFRFAGLRPGRYRLLARVQAEGKALQSQTVEFFDTAPPSGVELRLSPGSEVNASVAMEGGKLPPGKRTLRLAPAGDLRVTLQSASGDLDAEGAARIGGVFPGKYKVVLQPMPEGMYVKSVDLDGAVSEEVDLTRGGGRMKVTLAAKAGEVSGSVVDKDGAKVVNTFGAVLLLRDRDRLDIDDDDSTARMNAEGTYRFKSLRPGKYYLLAVDVFRSGDFTSPEAIKKYGAVAEEIEVREGERLRKDVHIVTKEMLDGKQ